MSRRFQFSLGALFWFVLVAAVNLVVWQRVWSISGRKPHHEIGKIYVMGGYQTEVFPDGHRVVTKLPPEPIEIPDGDGQPARLIYPTGTR